MPEGEITRGSSIATPHEKVVALWLSAEPQPLTLGGWGKFALLFVEKGKHAWRTNIQFISHTEFAMGECVINFTAGGRLEGRGVPQNRTGCRGEAGREGGNPLPAGVGAAEGRAGVE